jgi:hypothetical protein
LQQPGQASLAHGPRLEVQLLDLVFDPSSHARLPPGRSRSRRIGHAGGARHAAPGGSRTRPVGEDRRVEARLRLSSRSTARPSAPP